MVDCSDLEKIFVGPVISLNKTEVRLRMTTSLKAKRKTSCRQIIIAQFRLSAHNFFSENLSKNSYIRQQISEK